MITQMSHPLRVRGLKLLDRRPANGRLGVASFTGAWIETAIPPYAPTVRLSHPLRVRGLKPPAGGSGGGGGSRILYGCVD